jgi:uncharacterized cupin superfamily protein
VIKDKILEFPVALGEATVGTPSGWTIVRGAPQAAAWRCYSSEDGKRMAGVWESTPGTYQVGYDKWEFCHVLSGSCVISSERGAPIRLSAGNAFVIEPGFKGLWEVIETMRKHFVFVSVT